MNFSRGLIPQSFFSRNRFPSFFEDLENEISQYANWQNWLQNDISIESDDKHVMVQVPMPGLDPNEIEIQYKNGTLWIKGEKKSEEDQKNKQRTVHRKAMRSYTYTLNLPEQIDENADIQATNENGLLTIQLPKAQKNQTKKITVNKR